MSEPITRSEMYLAALNGEAVTPPEPITRMDMYMAYLNGMTDTYPDPITRTEQYLYKLCQNGMGGGGGVTIRNQNKTITENGSYKADSGYTGLGTVTVNVPQEEPVLQDKTVTENGTVTADPGYDGLGVVTVNVAAAGGADPYAVARSIFDKTITEYIDDGNIIMSDRVFKDCKLLKTVELPGFITPTGSQLFYNCTALETVKMPNLTRLWGASGWFENCTALKNVDLSSVASLGEEFINCTSLEEINFPSFNGMIATKCFYNCTALKKVDFGGPAHFDRTLVFSECASLETVIIRGTTLSRLTNVNNFENSGIANGTGYIYVPKTLADGSDGVATYQAATNWSTYATQIRAIEDYPEICGEVST